MREERFLMIQICKRVGGAGNTDRSTTWKWHCFCSQIPTDQNSMKRLSCSGMHEKEKS